ncbi:MAG: AAA family ATPase [Thermodesulfobacteriota bacterium]|nr:AAA family ATPase [Thermodesulfobacteriota bacterium]
MYATYFGLEENPFNLTPDPKYLFLSQRHNEALDHLLYGINQRKGFIAIVGGIGTGKTTLCRALLNQVDDATKTALIFNTCMSASELLKTINQEFGIPGAGAAASRKEQIDLLNRFLLNNFAKGGNAVLVFDEAQNLAPPVLEQIRMLSNLETEKEKLIQIIFVGQPELATLLGSPGLRQLNERIPVWYELKGLDRQEMQRYVEHRLVVAGSRGNVRFGTRALNAIHSYSQGIPRRINAVCDRALLIAYCRDEFSIKRNTVVKAIEDIRGNFTQRRTTGGWLRSRVAFAAIVALVFLAASLGGWHFKDQVSDLFSGIQEVDLAQGNSMVRKPVDHEKAGLINQPLFAQEPAHRQARAAEVQKAAADISLDHRASLAALFRLFKVDDAQGLFRTGDVYPGLFSFEGAPQLYRMFRKPHRLRIKTDSGADAGYLLIRKATSDGVIALDAEGNERAVGEGFILAHWAGEMSWVYPYEQEKRLLGEGMRGQGVLRVQEMLQEMGYAVRATGHFDSATVKEVKRFQRILGLEANGIVGTQTKALLYQMSG